MIQYKTDADSMQILKDDYGMPHQQITELVGDMFVVPPIGKDILKKKYGLSGRVVLTTAGLLHSGMSIETTIDALLGIIKQYPEVIFLIIGKTNPNILIKEGERYRKKLEKKVKLFKLDQSVRFMNDSLELPQLLEYLHLTDIYISASKGTRPAVSETFVYAMRCACPIISSPSPYAMEALRDHAGIIFDFQNSKQLSDAVIGLLKNESWRKMLSLNILKKTFSMPWENAAKEYAALIL